MALTAVVTGGAGFVGANLVRRLLREGMATHIFDRTATSLWRLEEVKQSVAVHYGDIGNYDWAKTELAGIKPDVIVHCAQYGGYPFQKDVTEVFRVNTLAAINFLRAAEEIGFKRFVHTGSSSEYGAKTTPMSEGDMLEPNSAYAASKAAATLYAAHRGREGKLPIITLRLFSIYGPWEEPTRLMPTAIMKALRGEDISLVAPGVARDFVHVDDVCDAYMAVIAAPEAHGEIVNVCTGRQQTLQDVGGAILAATGGKSKIVWGAEGRSFDTDRWVGNSSFAKTFLHWEAKINLEEGIAKTAAWFKDHRKEYDKISNS